MTNEKMLRELNNYMSTTNPADLIAIKEQLEQDIRTACNKKSGNLSKEKVIKSIEKVNEKSHPTFLGYMPYKEQYCFTNNFMAYFFNEDLGRKQAENCMDMSKVIPQNKALIHNIDVDIDNLKFFIKKCKSEKQNPPNPYVLNDGEYRIAFNPNHLFQMLSCFNISIIQCNQNPFAVCRVDGENNEFGILCPIRLKD